MSSGTQLQTLAEAARSYWFDMNGGGVVVVFFFFFNESSVSELFSPTLVLISATEAVTKSFLINVARLNDHSEDAFVM